MFSAMWANSHRKEGAKEFEMSDFMPRQMKQPEVAEEQKPKLTPFVDIVHSFARFDPKFGFKWAELEAQSAKKGT